MPRLDLPETKRSLELMFCGQCGTEIKKNDNFCTVCGRVVKRKVEVEEKQQPEQSVNNWTDLYNSAKPSKKKSRKKVLKKQKEQNLAEYEKDYLKRLKKKPRKKAAKKQKEVEEEKPQKIVSSPVLPSTSFSFSGSRLPTFLIAGFILGFITFAIIGLSSSSDPYGCTQCDPFLPGYDGPPPIEMDLYVPDDYYYDDYYYP